MIAAASLTRFRELLQRRLGWTFVDNDLGHTADVLAARAQAHGLTEREYLDRLAGRRWTAETAELASALSITETYFFRHTEQFRVLSERVLPELIDTRSGQRVLRLLSVGCSSGEEAYSLAIAAIRARPGPDWIVTVTGVDANREMLRRAREAVYSAWSLRDTPDDVRRRWFRPVEDGFRVADEVTATVRFVEHNVAGDDPQLWHPARYDVIFCRNLLMYLTADVAAELIRRMTRTLTDGGFLFLGHTDSLGSHPDGLDVCHVDGTVYYQRRVVAAPREPVPAPPPRRVTPAPPPPPRPPDRQRVLGLMRDDRFAEALDAAGTGDSLTRGVLLAQLGRVDEARDTANRLLHAGGPQADAHHLLGVCHELDCADRAAGQYRLAAYLDPRFAMPRLRMGLLARRRGDDRGAADHLSGALELLPTESDERIVHFGGGFGRLALTTLCRTELEACGVRR
ncbi:protein-glutamate O-methyltransferase [Actinoplanes philippinensis]|uniref:Chemotaxis protein methyltransferase CheR n=1 Tax=Actinoplanes philippinensis TaxID=35752 RepID=A0A1I2D0E2_9ACTN|nr:CheR family methyltransferase [Actinoplanes philippinensis]GIE74590.1 protein-glutamate O-methyltransferase [Actinoplanes philippinensis]SFE73503.1 chemotaxis protein methyltransferase CheR [Actinoplanes philippinensis]